MLSLICSTSTVWAAYKLARAVFTLDYTPTMIDMAKQGGTAEFACGSLHGRLYGREGPPMPTRMES